jgi:ammonia channel protein AmtB
MLIGFVGAFVANVTADLLVYIKVDDAVGATCVHGKISPGGVV